MSTSSYTDPNRLYRARKDAVRRPVLSTYTILGFISSGTYGRVYKALLKSPPPEDNTILGIPFRAQRGGELYAIKKFKPDKEGDVVTYTGISQSACREIALNREIFHENIVALREVILEDKAIYMVFEYAEHDFLQIIHHHSQSIRGGLQPAVLKSLLYQLLNGVHYLHSNFILHRDLKPANILVTSRGVVKIGDLGLARTFRQPLQPLWQGDKVVVTIWYRAPELLLGARHYTAAIDLWAVGCIYAEMLSLRPIFKGEEAKMDSKKIPFQRDQMTKILEVLGTPTKDRWPGITQMPEYQYIKNFDRYNNTLPQWYHTRSSSGAGFALISSLLEYDPEARITAREALSHKWFTQEAPAPSDNAFATLGENTYPLRRVTHDADDPKMGSGAGAAGVGGGGGISRPGSVRGTGPAGVATGSRKKARLE